MARGAIPMPNKVHPAQKNSGPELSRRVVSRAQPANQRTLGKDIDQQILLAVAGGFSEVVVRTKFVQMATNILGGVGVCYLRRNLQDLWLPSDGQPKMGRLPNWKSLAGDFSERCDVIAGTPNVQKEDLHDAGLTALLVRINPSPTETELFFVVLKDSSNVTASAAVLGKMASALQLWLNSQTAADANWQVNSLSSIIETVSQVEKQPTNQAAAEVLANLLAKQSRCSSVAVATKHKRRLRLAAISGISKLDRGSRPSRDYLATLNESVIRKTPGLFPAIDPNNNHLLQAHRQLASCLQAEAVYSFPLLDDDERIAGSIVMTGTEEQLRSDQLQRFAAAAAPALASSLDAVHRAQRSRLWRASQSVLQKLATLKVMIVIATLCGVIGAMFIPVTYRVRCNCVTEPVMRRFAVAPFAGLIVSGKVEPGDNVQQGEVLAELDGRTIRWEISGVTAERNQALRSREIELSAGNVPKVILAELEHERLTAEEAILKYKRDHLQIRSPIDGIVLSGSVERAEAASVETGQVLFEIGPTKPMKIEVAIPAEESAQVQSGFPVKVWIDGQEDIPFEGTIARIHPRSETRDALNVFVAEIEVANEDERLRPGMNGSVRIDCEQRTLGWSLFHKPMNYLRSRLTWW